MCPRPSHLAQRTGPPGGGQGAAVEPRVVGGEAQAWGVALVVV